MLECCEDRLQPSTVWVVPAPPSATEGSTNAFDFQRDDNTGPLTVYFSVSGTATSGSDYAPLSSLVTFNPGEYVAHLGVSTTNDSTSEPTETIIVTITSGSYTIGTPASATMSILDNDAQVVSVAVEDAGEADDPGAFVFMRIGDLSSTLTVNYTVGGSATISTDYSSIGTSVTFAANSPTATKVVTALADNVVEGDETVAVTITSGSGYSIGSPSTGTVYIHDDPPVVAVTATDTFEGAATGGLSFPRIGGDLSSSLTVDYTVSGTATSVTDYTALSGTLTFAADEDRVEVPVEALGDNLADDGETVIATIDDGGTDYTIDGVNYSATVTIADQPLTVWVEALNDGEEGGSNGTFRIWRAGDLSEELTVDYTVGGTATSGTDFTALSGSVTFDEDEDYVDVTVTVTNDVVAESTETVTLTLDQSEDYGLANDSDTLFIKDNDTRKVYWTGAISTDWDDPDNWSIYVSESVTDHDVPDENDEVYFDGTKIEEHQDCLNLGDDEEIETLTFKGIHLVGGYAGTVALAVPLLVDTYEQSSGIVDQPDSESTVTVAKALIWLGGTLNSTTSGSTLHLAEGSSGRIDAGSEGTISSGSTISLDAASTTGVSLTLKSGGLYFTGESEGIVIESLGLFKVLAADDATIELDGEGTVLSPKEKWLAVKTDGTCDIQSKDPKKPGTYNQAKALRNDGGKVIIHANVTARFAGRFPAVGGLDGSSVHQTSGQIILENGSAIDVENGITLYGGKFSTRAIKVPLLQDQPIAKIVGNMVNPLTEGNTGADIRICDSNVNPEGVFGHEFGVLQVVGDVLWTGGWYFPVVDATGGGSPSTKADLWWCTKTFTVSGAVGTNNGARLSPSFLNIPGNNVSNIATGRKWEVMRANTKIMLAPDAVNPPVTNTNLVLDPENANPVKKWYVKKN